MLRLKLLQVAQFIANSIVVNGIFIKLKAEQGRYGFRYFLMNQQIYNLVVAPESRKSRRLSRLGVIHTVLGRLSVSF